MVGVTLESNIPYNYIIIFMDRKLWNYIVASNKNS